jgi:hypothetical protein
MVIFNSYVKLPEVTIVEYGETLGNSVGIVGYDVSLQKWTLHAESTDQCRGTSMVDGFDQ